MTTRLKTVEYAHPPLASMVDNTLTALSQITVYLPESPSATDFKSVIAIVSVMGTATAQGNVTTRRLECRLGSAAYTAHTNSNLYTGSGEDTFVFHAVDLTTHFQTNWSGTSMTFDSSTLMDGTATGIAWTNICVTLYITYEYDDTSTTQVKTIRIPLNENVGNGVTTKPAQPLAIIPALDTELPEAGKTFRSAFVTLQGNINRAAATDATMTFQLDNLTEHTTGVFEGVSNADFWLRYIWDISSQLNTTNAINYYRWGSLASCFNHMQSWLTVTYEFTLAGTTSMFNSLLLPMELASPMGTSTTIFQRGERELFIEEPVTITTKHIAFYPHWDNAAATATLGFRVGTGSWVTYTDRMATASGGNGAMVRNDGAFTLVRGRNKLTFDAYTTSTSQHGFNLCGFWIVNYTSGIPAQGPGAANHTVFWNLGAVFDGAANISRILSAIAPTLPGTERFYSAIGTRYHYVSNSTGNAAGVNLLVERLESPNEGGLIWEVAYVDTGLTDPESGLRNVYSQIRNLFNRWYGDPMLAVNGNGGDRMDLQQARRWRAVLNNACASFCYLDLIMTYHNITFTVSGTITGSAGGTVNLELHRELNGETVATTSRVGNGAYSFTWYDNTEEVYVDAHEDDTHLGRSAPGLAV
jgi:hypothetical protein